MKKASCSTWRGSKNHSGVRGYMSQAAVGSGAGAWWPQQGQGQEVGARGGWIHRSQSRVPEVSSGGGRKRPRQPSRRRGAGAGLFGHPLPRAPGPARAPLRSAAVAWQRARRAAAMSRAEASAEAEPQQVAKPSRRAPSVGAGDAEERVAARRLRIAARQEAKRRCGRGAPSGERAPPPPPRPGPSRRSTRQCHGRGADARAPRLRCPLPPSTALGPQDPVPEGKGAPVHAGWQWSRLGGPWPRGGSVVRVLTVFQISSPENRQRGCPSRPACTRPTFFPAWGRRSRCRCGQAGEPSAEQSTRAALVGDSNQTRVYSVTPPPPRPPLGWSPTHILRCFNLVDSWAYRRQGDSIRDLAGTRR